jgi:uncharacterized membrane protein
MTSRNLLIYSLPLCQTVCFVGLILFAHHIWNARCESFGCFGIGIMWMVWVVAFIAALLFGLFVIHQCNGKLKNVARSIEVAQALIGLALAGYWVFKLT